MDILEQLKLLKKKKQDVLNYLNYLFLSTVSKQNKLIQATGKILRCSKLFPLYNAHLLTEMCTTIKITMNIQNY